MKERKSGVGMLLKEEEEKRGTMGKAVVGEKENRTEEIENGREYIEKKKRGRTVVAWVVGRG